MNINELLLELTKRNINITARKICEVWGMDEASFSRKKKDGTPIKYQKLKDLEQELCIKLINDEDKSKNYTDIPIKGNVSASMGYGLTVYDETKTGSYAINNQLAKDLGISLSKSEIIFARGDSMEPTIIGGDSLLVDLTRKEIHDGAIYCVRIDGEVYAKRLQKLPPNKIKVISDNQDKYDPFYIDLLGELNFDFEVIGEVRWWGRVAK